MLGVAGVVRGCVGLTGVYVFGWRIQAEKTKQEARSKDESVRRLEEKLQAAEAKLKAKEQMCQSLSEKVGPRCICGEFHWAGEQFPMILVGSNLGPEMDVSVSIGGDSGLEIPS